MAYLAYLFVTLAMTRTAFAQYETYQQPSFGSTGGLTSAAQQPFFGSTGGLTNAVQQPSNSFGSTGRLTNAAYGNGMSSAAIGGTASDSFAAADPYGRSLTGASGSSDGNFPVSAAVASSANQQPFNQYGYGSQLWKRDTEAVNTPAMQINTPGMQVNVNNTQFNVTVGRQRRQTNNYGMPQQGFGSQQGFASFPSLGQSVGTAIGTANALRGRSFSSGNTITHGGFSDSLANGEADGLQPSSTSIASSQSSGYRRRRAAYGDFSDAQNGQLQSDDTENDEAISDSGESPMAGSSTSQGTFVNADRRKRDALAPAVQVVIPAGSSTTVNVTSTNSTVVTPAKTTFVNSVNVSSTGNMTGNVDSVSAVVAPPMGEMPVATTHKSCTYRLPPFGREYLCILP